MLSRREWLVRVFGTAVAAAVAPLVDLTDTTPAFWNQPAIKKLMPWRISFPDGTVWTFDATVLSEKLLENGGTEFSLVPSGPMKMDNETIPPEPNASDEPKEARSVILTNGEGVTAELIEISPPELVRNEIDVSDIGDPDQNMVLGIARRGTLTMVVNKF